MNLNDYYNAQADANMKQLFSNLPVLNLGRNKQQVMYSEEEFNEVEALRLQMVKMYIFNRYWKESFVQATKQFLQQEYPDNWEEKWEDIGLEAEARAVPLVREKFNLAESREQFADVVNHPKAQLIIPETYEEAENTTLL